MRAGSGNGIGLIELSPDGFVLPKSFERFPVASFLEFGDLSDLLMLSERNREERGDLLALLATQKREIASGILPRASTRVEAKFPPARSACDRSDDRAHDLVRRAHA